MDERLVNPIGKRPTPRWDTNKPGDRETPSARAVFVAWHLVGRIGFARRDAELRAEELDPVLP